MAKKYNNETSKRTLQATPIPVPSTSSRSFTKLVSIKSLSLLNAKNVIKNLNNRLTYYIDRANNLENENSRLITELQTRETCEIAKMKSIYEDELSSIRKLLDETASKKTKLEIDTNRLLEENMELKIFLDKTLKDLKITEENDYTYEKAFKEISSKYNVIKRDLQNSQYNVKDLEKDIIRLKKLIFELRNSLDGETLARVDLENVIQSLREELSLKDEMHSQKVNKGMLSQQDEVNLCANRNELVKLYENKLKNLEEIQESENLMDNTPTSSITNQSLPSSSDTSADWPSISQNSSESNINSPNDNKLLKRKYPSEYNITESVKGDIEIIEVDSNGEFVKLHNNSNKNIKIGGWKIVRSVNNNMLSFTLNGSVTIKAYGYVTIWSTNSEILHQTSKDIIMKEQKWFTGDNMKTKLFNTNGEEVATSERIKRIKTSFGGEDIYYQRHPMETNNCILM